MIALQDIKVVNMIPPVVIKDNASWTTTQIDRLGYDWALILVNLGASDIAVAALKMQESDTDGSNFADVTGLIFGTSTDLFTGTTSALPTATDDNKVFGMWIDLKPRKRYLDLVATAGNGTAGTYASGLAILFRGKNHPRTASATGITGLLSV